MPTSSASLADSLLNRLLRYVRVHTTSDPASDTVPSTARQWDLLHILRDEMTAMGLADVHLDDKGYLFATIPATSDKPAPVLGLIAHVDTAPDFNGADVNPQIIENYDGGDITLPTSGDILAPRDFPVLNTLHGHTLVTTDGTSLLGSDDKSGIAIILTAAEYLLAHPEIPHGKIRIGFTPDEEIGRSARHFDVAAFGADIAYTVDGGSLGKMEYETFNADEAVVTLKGLSVHAGAAKGKMVNAWLRACEFQNRLPAHKTSADNEYLNADLGGDGLKRENIGTLKDTSGKVSDEPLDGIVAPGLRDAWYNAPYLHDGSAPTLEAAIKAHNNLTLTENEVSKLAAYVREVGNDE